MNYSVYTDITRRSKVYNTAFVVIIHENTFVSLGAMWSAFTVGNGVRQGGLISPVLYNVYT